MQRNKNAINGLLQPGCKQCFNGIAAMPLVCETLMNGCLNFTGSADFIGGNMHYQIYSCISGSSVASSTRNASLSLFNKPFTIKWCIKWKKPLIGFEVKRYFN